MSHSPSQSLRSGVSTINNDIRIARSPSQSAMSTFGSFAVPQLNRRSSSTTSNTTPTTAGAPQATNTSPRSSTTPLATPSSAAPSNPGINTNYVISSTPSSSLSHARSNSISSHATPSPSTAPMSAGSRSRSHSINNPWSSTTTTPHRNSLYDLDPNHGKITDFNFRKLSNEQIIDLMEREQDAIVLKLMREISILQDENRALKMSASHPHSLAHSYSPASYHPAPASAFAASPASSAPPPLHSQSLSGPSSGSHAPIKRSLSLSSSGRSCSIAALPNNNQPVNHSRSAYTRRKLSNESPTSSHPDSADLDPPSTPPSASSSASSSDENSVLKKEIDYLHAEIANLQRQLKSKS